MCKILSEFDLGLNRYGVDTNSHMTSCCGLDIEARCLNIHSEGVSLR